MVQVKRRIFISTGEVSGDLQGALLVEALYRQANLAGIDLEIVAAGGDRIAQAGAKLLADTTAIGSIGLLESMRYVLPTIQAQRQVKQWLRQNPPDLVVMIDYFGPNIGIANFTRSIFPTVPTVYYIAPQEWVWSISAANTKRVVKATDRLLAIFPAEAEYYRKWGSDVVWVGHPLIDRMQNAPSRLESRALLGIDPEATIVSLIPASRRQEIQYILPVMFQAARQLQDKLQERLQERLQDGLQDGLQDKLEDKLPQLEFLIPLSLETYREAIEQAIQSYGLRARLVSGQTREVLAASDLAITKSGTVNLELALLNVPQVVMYRLNPITAWIAENLLQYAAPFVSPVNLVLMQPIVPEMLQRQATPDRLVEESLNFLLNPDRRSQILADYERMRQQLGEPGVSDRAAQEILAMLPEMA